MDFEFDPFTNSLKQQQYYQLLPRASNEDAEEVAVTGDFRVDVVDGLPVAGFSRS